ncbi:hypothetical protein P5673_033097 [Acropora cervicornis]|uniref:Uncharacterized protein n=1 Tax=Acropora cervicornis TaxID=6130 RepID=A0AAD9PQF5_ACRCE|nr:hypothetical protein P5673_033097 [Acropora cervicornis]
MKEYLEVNFATPAATTFASTSKARTLTSVLLLTESLSLQMMLSMLTWLSSLAKENFRQTGVDTSRRRNFLRKEAAWARNT